jgi:hypothetical protein
MFLWLSIYRWPVPCDYENRNSTWRLLNLCAFRECYAGGTRCDSFSGLLTV